MACPGRLGGQRSKKKFRADRTSGIRGREAGDKAEQGGGHGEELHSYLGRKCSQRGNAAWLESPDHS